MSQKHLPAVLVVTAGSLILLLSFGRRSSFGLFLQPMSADLGWGRETFAFALALQPLLWGFTQPLGGTRRRIAVRRRCLSEWRWPTPL